MDHARHLHFSCETDQLLAALPVILIGLTPDLHVARWNRMAEGFFSAPASEVFGRAFETVSIRWNWGLVRQGLERSRAVAEAVRIDDLAVILPGDKQRILRLTISSIRKGTSSVSGFRIIGEDITQCRAMERQLAHAQKLRAIGQLASGIAHEINTPTQYVGDNIRFLKDAFQDIMQVLRADTELLTAASLGDVTEDLVRRSQGCRGGADLDYLISEIPLAIQQCLEGVDRISTIVRAMKDIAHPGLDEKTLVDLNQIIDATVTVARNEWKYVADMKTDFDRSLPPVFCHPAEIGQVILNMVINAAHSIEDVVKKGLVTKGVISIATRRSGGTAEIKISDTGGGIPAEIRHRIFEPFFTTKEIGRGTGQGLAICYPVIVEKHGGRVAFESEIGKGTTFTIGLPLDNQARIP